MMRFLMVMFWVSLSGVGIAQNYSFKVLVNKGQNEVKAGNNWIPIKVGASLKSTDELKIADNAYLGLVHASGKPLEVKQPGKYKVGELAAKVSGGNTVLTKYTDFILSSKTSKTGMAATGAVHRGGSLLKLYLPKAELAGVYSSKVVVSWDTEKIAGPYVVVLKSLFGDELLKTETSEGNLAVNLDDKIFIGEDNILVQVFAKADMSKGSEELTLKRLTGKNKEKVKASLDEISRQTSEETALNKLIMAGFYEQNKLLIDALTHYQEAIKLAPEVEAYREAYNECLIRNGLKEKQTKK